jgi:hypothetical protein
MIPICPSFYSRPHARSVVILFASLTTKGEEERGNGGDDG